MAHQPRTVTTPGGTSQTIKPQTLASGAKTNISALQPGFFANAPSFEGKFQFFSPDVVAKGQEEFRKATPSGSNFRQLLNNGIRSLNDAGIERGNLTDQEVVQFGLTVLNIPGARDQFESFKQSRQPSQQPIEQFKLPPAPTEAPVGGTAQLATASATAPRQTTTQFVQEFRAREGRVPTNEEKLAFAARRSGPARTVQPRLIDGVPETAAQATARQTGEDFLASFRGRPDLQQGAQFQKGQRDIAAGLNPLTGQPVGGAARPGAPAPVTPRGVPTAPQPFTPDPTQAAATPGQAQAAAPDQRDTQIQALQQALASFQAPQQPVGPSPQQEAFESQLAALQELIQGSFQPTAQEAETQTQIDALTSQARNLAASRDLGLAQIEDQPIALPFITGQQAGLQRQAATQAGALAAQAEPLQTQLARLQATRQGQLQAASSGLEFAGQAATRQLQQESLDLQRQQQAFNQAQPIKIGDRLVRLDPATGETTVIFEPAPVASKPVSVSPGAALVDSVTGEVIFNNPKDAGTGAAGLSPAQISDALSKGYDTDSKLNNYARIIQGGVQPQDLKDPTQAQSSAASFAARVAQASPVIDELERKFASQFGKAPFVPERFKSEDRKQFEQAERTFINAVLRRESGAVISPSEFAEARLQYIPQAGDATKVLNQKRETRRLILEGLTSEAGRALEQGRGDDLDNILDGIGFRTESQTSLKGKLNTFKVGSRSVTVRDDIQDRIKQADEEFFRATGKHIQVNSSFRSREKQTELFKSLSAKGARVAAPGTSFHERGLAIDVTNWQEAEPFLRRQGLRNELTDDKGHFSIGEFA